SGAEGDDRSSTGHRFYGNETEILFSAEEKRLGRSVQHVELLVRDRTGEMDTTRAERLQRWPQGSVAGHGERNAKPGGRRHCQVISFVGLHGPDDQKGMTGELGCRWRGEARRRTKALPISSPRDIAGSLGSAR